jgi:ketol-acid reductoisomerase
MLYKNLSEKQKKIEVKERSTDDQVKINLDRIIADIYPHYIPEEFSKRMLETGSTNRTHLSNTMSRNEQFDVNKISPELKSIYETSNTLL